MVTFSGPEPPTICNTCSDAGYGEAEWYDRIQFLKKHKATVTANRVPHTGEESFLVSWYERDPYDGGHDIYETYAPTLAEAIDKARSRVHCSRCAV